MFYEEKLGVGCEPFPFRTTQKMHIIHPQDDTHVFSTYFIKTISQSRTDTHTNTTLLLLNHKRKTIADSVDPFFFRFFL
jgi:hypothetical protein